jgi:acetyltransferase-like isoleucine patch superfamily enzyme
MLQISPNARISHLADIEDSTKGTRIIIEAGVIVDSFVKIKPAGGTGDLVIGEQSIINSGCVIYTGNGITFGKNVLVAANCTFSPTTHEYRSRDKLIRDQGFVQPSPLFGGRRGIVVEDDVWIGANCVVMEGALIRQGAVISAGSVIKGELEAYGIYGGEPLKRYGYRQ